MSDTRQKPICIPEPGHWYDCNYKRRPFNEIRLWMHKDAHFFISVNRLNWHKWITILQLPVVVNLFLHRFSYYLQLTQFLCKLRVSMLQSMYMCLTERLLPIRSRSDNHNLSYRCLFVSQLKPKINHYTTYGIWSLTLKVMQSYNFFFSKNVTFYQAYVKSQQALSIVQNKWRSTNSQFCQIHTVLSN